MGGCNYSATGAQILHSDQNATQSARQVILWVQAEAGPVFQEATAWGAGSSYSASEISKNFGGYTEMQYGCEIFFTDLNPTDQGDYRCEQQTPIPVWGLVVGSGTLQCSRRSTAQLCHPKFQQSNWPTLPLTINCSSSDL